MSFKDEMEKILQDTNDALIKGRHKCEGLEVREMIAFKSLGIGWIIEDETGEQFHGVRYCPYCGVKLDE